MRIKETYATGFVKPKTTALFFDKLFIPNAKTMNGIPLEIQFVYKGLFPKTFSREEIFMAKDFKIATFRNNSTSLSNMISYFSDSEQTKINYKLFSQEEQEPHPKEKSKPHSNDALLSFYRNHEIQKIAHRMRKFFGVNIVPIFFDKTDFEKSLNILNPNMQGFQTDDKEHSVYEAIINCDKMIDEDELSWEQVLEIRKDRKSILKLRKFRNWADYSFQNYGKEQIIESIEKSYEDYSEALKKHGVKKFKGGFATIGVTAITTIMSAWGGNIINYIGAGLTIALSSKPLIKEIKNYIDVRKQPIAYYYDITKKISKE